MSEPIPGPLADRLRQVAGKIALGRHAETIPNSVRLACDLIEAQISSGSVPDVAALNPLATWRDAGDSILAMLEDLGYIISEPDDEDAAWTLVLRAFGFWGLPLADFYSPFLHRLPPWDEQDDLGRQLNLLLDELDHRTDPAGRGEVEERMHVAVRDALT